MEEVKALVTDIKQGRFKPVYFLMGDEPYYIDSIAKFIETTVLDELQREFNQTVLYGRDVSIADVIGQAKRYPMMADHQVVVVKEAQHLSRTIEELDAYAKSPQPTTVLVICYKYKTLDKRKKLYKTLKSNGVIFESKKLYENKVPEWIVKVLKGKGYAISHKASQLLVEFLGNDLGRISKELEKLYGFLPQGSTITPELIEEHIGISKDFNNFELKKALGERNVGKAARIIQYFGQNPKDNPFVVTVTVLYNFFSQLLQYHGLPDHSPRQVASALGVSPYFVDEFRVAASNYPMKRVSQIVASLRELDMKGKGVGAAHMSQEDLLKELLTKIV